MSSSNNNSGTRGIWCPEQQIYIDGSIEQSTKAQAHIEHIQSQKLPLYIFGYGSLCWRPDGVLAHPSVKSVFGKAIGFQRCWSQKSADHRGNVHFPGLVCTLLSDEEVRAIEEEHTSLLLQDSTRSQDHDPKRVSMTEGLVYEVPAELVTQCLEELDFREKGGYARDLIDVVVAANDDESDSNNSKTKTIQAMLYRGTADNPAFSNRALLDEIYAASVMSVAIGPSGKNDVYLYSLHDFLSNASDASNINADGGNESSGRSSHDDSYQGDSRTRRLTAFSKKIQHEHDVYFLYGSGSNQHNQLLLNHSVRSKNAAKIVNGDEAHDFKEIVLLVPKKVALEKDNHDRKPKALYAGGGHSALLTNGGDFYLWGWNEAKQLARDGEIDYFDNELDHPIVPPLDIQVECASLGHNHTLVIEKETGYLYACGDNNRGQVTGITSGDQYHTLTKLDLGEFVSVSAGLFHSAAITKEGELCTFGCGRFGQTLETPSHHDSTVRYWKPSDGSKLVKVACGRRHTVVLDEFGRVYTMGDNKYNQLGRSIPSKRDSDMKLVDGILGQKGSGCIDIDCGWSHTIAIVDRKKNGNLEIFGWGRNDKHQLTLKGTTGTTGCISTPYCIEDDFIKDGIKAAFCGPEFVTILNGRNEIISCGWNEHGNLGVGHSSDVSEPTVTTGARICSHFHLDQREVGKVLLATGGGHTIATITNM